MLVNSSGVAYTLSAAVDEFVKIFISVKRHQEVVKLKHIAPGDFYYYTFVAALYDARPLEIIESDISHFVNSFTDLDVKTLQTCIDAAILIFAKENGFANLLSRAKQTRKYSWRIIK